jgi:hypothetical protein
MKGWDNSQRGSIPRSNKSETRINILALRDIAVLTFIYHRETLIAKKIGLLQSKRLYPDNDDVDGEDEVGFLYEMNAFIRRESSQAIGALHREFSFGENCVYGAIHSGSDQVKSIDALNRDFGKAVYCLLYNPHTMPFSISYALRERIRIDQSAVGCRVNTFIMLSQN